MHVAIGHAATCGYWGKMLGLAFWVGKNVVSLSFLCMSFLVCNPAICPLDAISNPLRYALPSCSNVRREMWWCSEVIACPVAQRDWTGEAIINLIWCINSRALIWGRNVGWCYFDTRCGLSRNRHNNCTSQGLPFQVGVHYMGFFDLFKKLNFLNQQMHDVLQLT